jgi:hypothetical protein
LEYFQGCGDEVYLRVVRAMIKAERVPFPHQETGARFLMDRPGAILADEQGVGKTDTAVRAVVQGGMRPCLVVCPANVRVIWERVFMAVATGAEVIRPAVVGDIDRGDVVVVGFNRLAEWHARLVARRFAVMIVDEAHLLRNSSELRSADKRALEWSVEHGLHHSMHRTEAALEISQRIPVVWALTGTPILSRPAFWRCPCYVLIELDVDAVLAETLGQSQHTLLMLGRLVTVTDKDFRWLRCHLALRNIYRI